MSTPSIPITIFVDSWLFFTIIIPNPIATAAPPSPPRGFLINCGSDKDVTVDESGLTFKADNNKGYIQTGNSTTVKVPVLPILTNLRFFPDKTARRYCYVLPVQVGSKYMVRTTYFYGGFDGGTGPPLFDQFVDGTQWSLVNTTADHSKGMASFYELIISAHTKTLSVCLARNALHTGPNASPFISALEVVMLDDPVYKPVVFHKYALATVARSMFGDSKSIIGFPDDSYNRLWLPFDNPSPKVTCQSNITASDFWNAPPATALCTAITTSRGKTLEVDWPVLTTVPTASTTSTAAAAGNDDSYHSYYVALYFQDTRNPSPYSWRVFNVTLNGDLFYSRLNVTSRGVAVYGNGWPLFRRNKVVLTPEEGVPVGPLINAGEVMQILPLGGTTFSGDVAAMEDVAKNLRNPPSDWQGDPCLPLQHSWTGVTCSVAGNTTRITNLNLTGAGLSGTISPTVANLTALKHLWLPQNSLTGKILDLGSLMTLETLHLENNELEEPVPPSLDSITSLKERYL